MILAALAIGNSFVFDFKKLLMALSDKEAAAQSEVDAFMENCAKRWQTREGTLRSLWLKAVSVQTLGQVVVGMSRFHALVDS